MLLTLFYVYCALFCAVGAYYTNDVFLAIEFANETKTAEEFLEKLALGGPPIDLKSLTPDQVWEGTKSGLYPFVGLLVYCLFCPVTFPLIVIGFVRRFFN